MKSKVKCIITLMLAAAVLLAFSACAAEDPDERREIAVESYNAKVEACCGKDLTREELAEKIARFESVQEAYKGRVYEDEAGEEEYNFAFPDPKLEVPGKHTVTEKTRYIIEPLGKDDRGCYLGIKVTVIGGEPDAAEGLPIKDIEGTYSVTTQLDVRIKGKDEDEDWRTVDSEEITVVFHVKAIDEKTVRLSADIVVEDNEMGIGTYDPATGICEMTSASNGHSNLLTFTKENGQIQFVMVDLDNEKSAASVGIKTD